jgi:hypothetical protein
MRWVIGVVDDLSVFPELNQACLGPDVRPIETIGIGIGFIVDGSRELRIT